MVEGLLIHRAAEHGDDAVGKDEINRRQYKAARNDQHDRVAHAALCLAQLISAQRHADEGTAAVAHHNGEGQRHNGQGEHDGVRRVAVGAEVACIGNEDLVNDVVKCAHQQ